MLNVEIEITLLINGTNGRQLLFQRLFYNMLYAIRYMMRIYDLTLINYTKLSIETLLRENVG